MAKHHRLIRLFGECILVISALGIHLWYLLHTTFVDWPEMILFPWFLTKDLLYYRDIAIAYAPGINYLLHGAYLLLGYSVASERIIAYICILFTDVLVYLSARKLTRSHWAGGMALFFFVLWQPVYSGNTIWYETVIAPIYLLGYLIILEYCKKPSFRKIVLIGVMLAAATLIKQTAVWAVAAVCLFILIGQRNRQESLLHAIVIGFIVAGVNLFAWGYFGLLGAGKEYWFWVFQSLTHFSQGSSLYALAPPRSDITLIIPSFVALGVLVIFNRTKSTWLLILLTVVLFFAGLPRWSLHRFQPVLAFLAISFGQMSCLLTSKNKRIVAASFLALFIIAAGSWRSFRVFITLRDPMQPQFFGETYKQILSYTREQAPGDVFVLGNYYHLYFGLDQRPAVLPWVPLFPVNAQMPGMQAKLIASIEASKVPYILFVPFHPDSGYYDGYMPEELFLYVRSKYEKIGAAPIRGGELLRRK